MSQLAPWAAGKFLPNGNPIKTDRCSCLKTGVGTYTIALENALGKPECCPLVTPWFSTGGAIFATCAATMANDGSSVELSFVDHAGAPVDVGFCVVIQRFED